jgi:putative membrane protein
MMHDWGGGWGIILGPLYMVMWVAILAAIIALVVRWTGLGGQASSRTTSTARDILDERFARGEIDDDEYEKRRRILES